jgi:hypothetical protein
MLSYKQTNKMDRKLKKCITVQYSFGQQHSSQKKGNCDDGNCGFSTVTTIVPLNIAAASHKTKDDGL